MPCIISSTTIPPLSPSRQSNKIVCLHVCIYACEYIKHKAEETQSSIRWKENKREPPSLHSHSTTTTGFDGSSLSFSHDDDDDDDYCKIWLTAVGVTGGVTCCCCCRCCACPALGSLGDDDDDDDDTGAAAEGAAGA